VYNRYVKRTSKFMAHDEADDCNVGDRVSDVSLPFETDPFLLLVVTTRYSIRVLRI
jgi:hypothetical protein